MTLPVLKIEELRQAALARLRAAVAAANAPDAPASASALKGLTIPKHRFVRLKPENAPFLHVAAKSDGGEGLSHQLPEIEAVGTLHINIFVAGGRAGAADLDLQAGQISQAVCLALLEDSSFLEQFSYVAALRIIVEDGEARGDNAEIDCVLVQIELVLAEGQIEYQPRLPADAGDFLTADMTAAIAPVPGADPPEDHTVRQQTPIDPEE